MTALNKVGSEVISTQSFQLNNDIKNVLSMAVQTAFERQVNTDLHVAKSFPVKEESLTLEDPVRKQDIEKIRKMHFSKDKTAISTSSFSGNDLSKIDPSKKELFSLKRDIMRIRSLIIEI